MHEKVLPNFTCHQLITHDTGIFFYSPPVLSQIMLPYNYLLNFPPYTLMYCCSYNARLCSSAQ